MNTLTDLYQHFDELVFNDADPDTLFASSYIKGFIALEAVNFGDEQQTPSKALAEKVTQALINNKTELTPQDQTIVNNYWLSLQPIFK
ncbi:YfcL family protein [Thalassotalea sp. LPB0316]|uniref:YfcL family protein n=1 Tax=Thalassotalea sp. LPB0316 TaxID=2769490 RepID=UPI001868F0B1|nr:YfcL family protein [Thalassotalea sp. LPB0316]QOL25285.1 YfcL family protein [Thalassotalea sp. LPB0316]